VEESKLKLLAISMLVGAAIGLVVGGPSIIQAGGADGWLVLGGAFLGLGAACLVVAVVLAVLIIRGQRGPRTKRALAFELQRWNLELTSCLKQNRFSHPATREPGQEIPHDDQPARDCFYGRHAGLMELLYHSDYKGWSRRNEWFAICSRPKTPDEFWRAADFLRKRFIQPWLNEGDHKEAGSSAPLDPPSPLPATLDELARRLQAWNNGFTDCLSAKGFYPPPLKRRWPKTPSKRRGVLDCYYGERRDEVLSLMHHAHDQGWVGRDAYRLLDAPKTPTELWEISGYISRTYVQPYLGFIRSRS
jgi:hypothetical protein